MYIQKNNAFNYNTEWTRTKRDTTYAGLVHVHLITFDVHTAHGTRHTETIVSKYETRKAAIQDPNDKEELQPDKWQANVWESSTFRYNSFQSE